MMEASPSLEKQFENTNVIGSQLRVVLEELGIHVPTDPMGSDVARNSTVNPANVPLLGNMLELNSREAVSWVIQPTLDTRVVAALLAFLLGDSNVLHEDINYYAPSLLHGENERLAPPLVLFQVVINPDEIFIMRISYEPISNPQGGNATIYRSYHCVFLSSIQPLMRGGYSGSAFFLSSDKVYDPKTLPPSSRVFHIYPFLIISEEDIQKMSNEQLLAMYHGYRRYTTIMGTSPRIQFTRQGLSVGEAFSANLFMHKVLQVKRME